MRHTLNLILTLSFIGPRLHPYLDNEAEISCTQSLILTLTMTQISI